MKDGGGGGGGGPSIEGSQNGWGIYYVMVMIIIHVATHNASKNPVIATLRLDLIALFFVGAFSTGLS